MLLTSNHMAVGVLALLIGSPFEAFGPSNLEFLMRIASVDFNDIVRMILDSLHFFKLDLHHFSNVNVQVHQSVQYEFDSELLIHLFDSSFIPANDLLHGQMVKFFALPEFMMRILT